MPNKLMTEKELQDFRDMELPPKRGTQAYKDRQDAIRRAKEAELDSKMDEGFRKATRKKAGGSVKKYRKGGSVKSSASKRGDGCVQRGKTKGTII
jgi:hypothetical protein